MEETKYKKGLWTAEEDKILMDYVRVNGKGRWNRIPKKTGLRRCGRSCRLRWMNYLCPNVKRGNFTQEEEDLIVRLHKLLGNRVKEEWRETQFSVFPADVDAMSQSCN